MICSFGKIILKTIFNFSIEEAKQKREHEKMLKTAEDKKVKVRKTIATLRSKFKKLKVVNKDLPKHLALVAQVSVAVSFTRWRRHYRCQLKPVGLKESRTR